MSRDANSFSDREEFIHDLIVGAVSNRQLSDAEVGKELLAGALGFQLDRLGIAAQSASLDLATAVVTQLANVEASTADQAAVEKSIKLAAAGEFERAGRMLRELMWGGAISLRYMKIGNNALQKARRYGRMGGEQKKVQGQQNASAVVAEATRILSTRQTPMTRNQLASQITQRVQLSQRTVNNHLAEAISSGKLPSGKIRVRRSR